MFKLVTTKRAQRQLRNLPFNYREQIIASLRELTEDLSLGKQLGEELGGYWSLKIGVYRAIYKVFSKEMAIKVYKIEHRAIVYD